MHFSYILQNKDGRGLRVPRWQAWQWVHNLDHLEHLTPILNWIDMRVTIDQLSLLNVYLDHTAITAPKNDSISFGCKSQILYSRVIKPDRIIDMNSTLLQSL